MKFGRLAFVLVAFLSGAAGLAWPANAGTEEEKLDTAAEVVREIMAIPEKGIPPVLLRNAQGIAIIPGVIKLGFLVGGRYGQGVLMERKGDGQWSDPLFVSFPGGGIGWQVGAQSTDIILVFKSKRGTEGIRNGKFTLGVDASAAAGPVGRELQAATDAQLKAEIYSYSRSRGLFAGISLEGAALRIDNDANAAYYGKRDIRPDEILAGRGHESAALRKLQRVLAEYASKAKN